MKRVGLATIAAMICGQALAGDPTIDRMRICAVEADEAKRLACYDFQIGRSKTGQNDDLGVTGDLLRHKQQKAGIAKEAPQEMSAKVATISRGRFDKFVVTLDNGQIWAQQEVLDFTLHVGDVITVRRGLMGALWMVSSSGRVQTRVQRIN